MDIHDQLGYNGFQLANSNHSNPCFIVLKEAPDAMASKQGMKAHVTGGANVNG